MISLETWYHAYLKLAITKLGLATTLVAYYGYLFYKYVAFYLHRVILKL